MKLPSFHLVFPAAAVSAALSVLLLAGIVGVPAEPREPGEAREPAEERAAGEERERGWQRSRGVPFQGERWDDWSDFYLSSPVDPQRDPLGWFGYQHLRAGVLKHREEFLGHVSQRVLESEEVAALGDAERERIKRIIDLRQELITLDQEHFVSLFRSEAKEVLEGLKSWEERTEEEDSPRHRIATASRERLERLIEEGEDFESLAEGIRELAPGRWFRRHHDREDRLKREIYLLEQRLDNLREEVERLEWESRTEQDDEEDPRARRLREHERDLRDQGVLYPPRREDRALMPGTGRDATPPELQDPADEEPRDRRNR